MIRPSIRDTLELLVVPCLPLGRAAAMANGSCMAVTVSVIVAAACVGGAAAFGAYARGGYVLVGSIHGYSILVVGWLLYVLSPLFALGAFGAASLKDFACVIDDTGGPPCNPAFLEPHWIALAATCFLLVAGASVLVRYELLRRYDVPPSGCSGCCDCCGVCCCASICAVARLAMHMAREAREREHVDEIPAY